MVTDAPPGAGDADAPPDVAVVSDTHGETDARLRGRTREAVAGAALVVHAGDFTTSTVLEAFEAVADDLVAVYGNNDDGAVRDRLPDRRAVEVGSHRLVVVHGHEHDATARSLLGRQEAADLVVVGHSHRPSFDDEGPVPVLNPGSHADPRWHRPAHAELRSTAAGLAGRLCDPDGTVFETFEL